MGGSPLTLAPQAPETAQPGGRAPTQDPGPSSQSPSPPRLLFCCLPTSHPPQEHPRPGPPSRAPPRPHCRLWLLSTFRARSHLSDPLVVGPLGFNENGSTCEPVSASVVVSSSRGSRGPSGSEQVLLSAPSSGSTLPHPLPAPTMTDSAPQSLPQTLENRVGQGGGGQVRAQSPGSGAQPGDERISGVWSR